MTKSCYRTPDSMTMQVLMAAVALLPFGRFVLSSEIAGWVFYVGLALTGTAFVALALYRRSCIKADVLAVCFLAVCALSICFSEFKSQFMAWERYGAFLILVFAVGPLMRNAFMTRCRIYMLKAVCCLCVLCSIYYNALYVFMLTHYCSWMSRYVYVWWHTLDISMLFGALSGIGALFTGWLLLRKEFPWTGIREVWRITAARLRWLFVAGCFLSCLNATILASSRIAIVAFAVALTVMCGLHWYWQRKLPRGAAITVALLVSICGLSVVIPMTPIMDIKFSYIEKNDDDYMASRRQLWHERGEEIKEYRFFGVGFACVDLESTSSYISTQGNHNYNLELNQGKIEPGSSWMYVLSATGIVGFLLLLMIVLRSILHAVCARHVLIAALLVFFTVHMLAEGYVISAGAMLSFIFWLTVADSVPGTGKRGVVWRPAWLRRCKT